MVTDFVSSPQLTKNTHTPCESLIFGQTGENTHTGILAVGNGWRLQGPIE